MQTEEKKEKKVDISKVLRIILVRSFTYLSLLVIIVFVIYFLRKNPHQDPVSRGSKGLVAIVDGYTEYKSHIQGLREGLLFKGIHTISYDKSNLEEIKDEDPIYVLGTDRVRLALEKLPGHIIVGYARFREKPADNYTGIFSGFDWGESLKLYRSILPKIKTIGVLYTDSSPLSRKQVQALQRFARDHHDLEIKVASVSEDGRDLEEKLDSLLDSVDALLGVVKDKNIEADLSLIAADCLNRKIPFIGGGNDGALKGALISLEYDQKRLGRQAAEEIIYPIIKNKINPVQIPIIFPHPDVFINLSTAYKLGIQFPKYILEKAREKYH